MKKSLTVLLAVLMVISLIPFSALADTWTSNSPTVSLTAEGPDSNKVIAVTINVSESDNICVYTFSVGYDSSLVSVDEGNGTFEYENDDGDMVPIGLTLDGANTTDNFNFNYDRTKSGDGEQKVFLITDAREKGISKNGFTATMFFKVNDGVADGSTFTFELKDGVFDDASLFEVGNKDGDVIDFPSTGTSVSIVPPVSALQISGKVATPAKGASDTSDIGSADGLSDVTVTWSPALSSSKFAASTAYTATVTVTPKSGVTLKDDATVTGGPSDLTFTRDGDKFTATKTFEKTKDKELTSLTLDTAPSAKTYEHGDTLNTAGMVLTAAYDNGTSENVATKAEIKYNTGDALSKGDTSVEASYDGKSVTIDGLTVNAKKVTVTVADIADQAYTGSAIEPAVNVNCAEEGVSLVKDTDYTVAYASNTDVGKAYVTVSPVESSKYTFTESSKNFNITPGSISEGDFTIDTAAKKYTGAAIEPTVTSDKYTAGTDYKVTYSNNKAVGEATIKIDGQGNFGGSITKTFKITAVQLTMAATAEDKTYDGTDVATIKSGALTGVLGSDDVKVAEASIEGKFDDANAGTDKAVTTEAKFTLTGAAAGNYTLKQPTGLKASIAKAASEDKTASVSGKYGSSGEYDLSADILEGCTAGTMDVSNTEGALTGAPTMNGTTLSYSFVNDPDKVGKTAVVTIPMSGTNYEDYNIVITFTVADKLAQTIDAKNVKATYGDTGKSVKGTVTVGDGAVSYSLKSGDAVTVNSTTGALTINKAGTAVVTVTAAATEEYAEATKDVKVTINKADVTVTAVDKTISIGEELPDLSAPAEGTDYTVDGLKGSDKLGGTIQMAYQKDGADVTPDIASEGTYDIVITGATAPSDNYNTLTVKNGTLTINSKLPQTVTAEDVVTVYGSIGAMVAGSTDGDGAVTYAVKSGEDVVSVNSASGLLTIKKAGTAVITVTAAETETYAKGEKEITVTVDRKEIPVPAADTTAYTYNGSEQAYQIPASDAYTVTGAEQTNAGSYDVTVALNDKANTVWEDGTDSDKTFTFAIAKAEVIVTAIDRSIYVGAKAPDLSAPAEGTDYVVTGLQGTDTLDSVSLSYSKDGTAATPDTSKAGNYDIVVEAAVSGTDYNLTTVNGVLKISSIYYEIVTPTKNITVTSSAHGRVIVTPTSAVKGSTVTVTTIPDEGYELGTLVVTDSTGNKVQLTDLGGGKQTFKMPGDKVVVSATFVPKAKQSPFVDVPTSAYYFEPVVWAVEQGITTGTSATTFGPNESCTRAQAVTFLWRMAGKPVATSAVNPFTDVAEKDYFYSAVLWAVEKGITLGTSATTFSPDDIVTRAQMVTFLWRYAGKPSMGSANPFTDVAEKDYFYSAVLWAVEKNITVGTSATTFSPDDTCNRSQTVTFLYRYNAK